MTENAKETATTNFYTWAVNNEGAFKAFLALQHTLENIEPYFVKTKKQYKTFVESLINLLLTDTPSRDTFLAYEGRCPIAYDPKTCEVVKIIDESKGRLGE